MAGRAIARVVLEPGIFRGLINPDAGLAPDHRARLVVGFVETLDLTMFYDKIEAREGTVGRPAADPAVLFRCGFWRRWTGLARRAKWTGCPAGSVSLGRGGVPFSYHGLADFRVAHASVLDVLLTKSLAAFMAEELFDADEIVVDGTKIKASAARARTSVRCVWTRRRRQPRRVSAP